MIVYLIGLLNMYLFMNGCSQQTPAAREYAVAANSVNTATAEIQNKSFR